MTKERRFEHPENADAPIETRNSETVTDAKREQPEKADAPIEVTLGPRMIFVTIEYVAKASLNFPAIMGLLISMVIRLLHPENTSLPIKVTEIGMAIEVKLKQLENARSPIDVTEAGIFTEIKLKQLEKAEALIEVTDSLIVTD